MKVKDILDVDIIDYDHLGLGVAKVNNFPIFVPYALKGEKVRVEITRVTKNIAESKLIEVLVESKERNHDICPHYLECGGCSLMHMSYAEQLRFKRRSIRIIHIGKRSRIAKVAVQPARIKRRAIDLRMERTHASRKRIRIRRNLERREIRMGKSYPKPRRCVPLSRCTESNKRSSTDYEISLSKLNFLAQICKRIRLKV